MKIGDPFEKTTALGPVISNASLDRILGMVDAAKREGARLVAGGARLGGEHAEGFFLPITILADVDNSSYIAQHDF